MTKKEKAAREAAARYSSNLAFAILEYGALSGQLSSVISESGRGKLQDEMLSLLPRYRHPTYNKFAESFWFIDPDGIKLNASGYEIPIFVELLEKEGIAENLLTGIKEYARESELRKIELAQCLELKQQFSDAERIYADMKAERSDKRNAAVVRALGFSTGRASKRFDNQEMWVDYVILVRRKGMSPSQAVKEVHKRYERQSEDATVEALNEQRTSLLRKIEQRYPEMYDEAKKRLTGLVPTRFAET